MKTSAKYIKQAQSEHLPEMDWLFAYSFDLSGIISLVGIGNYGNYFVRNMQKYKNEIASPGLLGDANSDYSLTNTYLLQFSSIVISSMLEFLYNSRGNALLFKREFMSSNWKDNPKLLLVVADANETGVNNKLQTLSMECRKNKITTFAFITTSKADLNRQSDLYTSLFDSFMLVDFNLGDSEIAFQMRSSIHLITDLAYIPGMQCIDYYDIINAIKSKGRVYFTSIIANRILTKCVIDGALEKLPKKSDKFKESFCFIGFQEGKKVEGISQSEFDKIIEALKSKRNYCTAIDDIFLHIGEMKESTKTFKNIAEDNIFCNIIYG